MARPLGEKAMSNAERQAKWAATHKPPPRQLAPCGTRAAYERHRRKGEPPCADCVEANRLANAENYQRTIKANRATSKAGRSTTQ